jgi:hypothetical protein
VAAPNAQPAGNRPGPGKVNTHAPHEAGRPSATQDNSTKVTPGNTKPIVTKPVGGGKKNPLK